MKMYPVEIMIDSESIHIEQYIDGESEVVVISHEQVEVICEWLKHCRDQYLETPSGN